MSGGPSAGTSTSTARSLLGPALFGALGLAAAAALHLRDPHDPGSYGFCPFQSVTGMPCPGCGGLRAVNDLTRGDLVAAVGSNALAVMAVLGLAALWIVWFVRRATGQHRAPLVSAGLISSTPGSGQRIAAWCVVAVIVVFAVVRTTPWGSWLAP